MGKNAITTDSVTAARRIRQLLSTYGIRTSIYKSSYKKNGIGCGFSVEIELQNMREAAHILNRAGIDYKMISSDDGEPF